MPVCAGRDPGPAVRGGCSESYRGDDMQKQGKTIPPNSGRKLPALFGVSVPSRVTWGLHQGSVSHDAWGGIDQQPLWHWDPPMRLTYRLSGTHP